MKQQGVPLRKEGRHQQTHRKAARWDSPTTYMNSPSPTFANMADATLVVQEHSLPVHKAILAANSDVFASYLAVLNQPSLPVPISKCLCLETKPRMSVQHFSTCIKDAQ